MSSVAENLAHYVTRLRFSDIPPKVVGHTKLVLLDSIACAIGCAKLGKSWCDAALRVVRAQGAVDQATVWHYGDRVSSLNAIFVNSLFAHGMDFSDDLAGVQIGGIVPTTALTLGEHLGSSGKDVIAASVIGYDLAGRLAESMDSQGLYIRGLQPTAFLGGFVAAAVAGRLLRLDAQQLAHAFGIVASYSGGTIEFLADGTDTKRLHPAKCSHSGALAACLAKEGMTGPRTIFEGPHGVFRAYSDNPRLEKLLEDLGRRFDILDTSIKPLPFCDGNFAPLEAALLILRENRISVADIERIHCRMLPSLIPYVIEFHGSTTRKYRVETELDAQMSLPYCMAVGLLKAGDVWFEDFDRERYRDPAILALADRIHAEGDASLATGPTRPITMPCVVTVTVRGGRSHTKRIDYQKGDPRNPLSEAEIVGKFRRCVRGSLDEIAADQVLAKINTLDELSAVSKLVRLLVARRDQEVRSPALEPRL